MTTIIDRRLNPKDKNLVNRNRFIRRAKDAIKKSIKDNIQKRNISDIESGEKIKIPVKDLIEDHFRKSTDTGRRDHILPGNKDFLPGDLIKKPTSGGGGRSREGSDDPEVSEDDFQFTLTREEFINFFFEDLDLPDMIKQQLKEVKKFQPHRAGFTTTGSPCNLSVEHTMRRSWARRLALGRPKLEDIEELERELEELEINPQSKDNERINFLKEEIERLNRRAKVVPYIDPIDLRYRAQTLNPLPLSQAVMFCLMDVSGSMGEREKDIAKRFFMLLYLFLTTKYETIDIIFVKHHTVASECSEEDFFYGKETGGTIVSSGLELIHNIIKERYPINDWNIYVSQCSDGDNFDSDTNNCNAVLREKLLPIVQYYCYIEIVDDDMNDTRLWLSKPSTSLWKVYMDIKNSFKVFQMKSVSQPGHIWPVFKELFEKKDK